MATGDWVPEHCCKSTLILGCGNILLGDDGFGPAVVACLQNHYPVPPDVALVDAGTGASEVLFDLTLSPKKPRRLVLVDTQDSGKPPGTIAATPLNSLPLRKGRNFSSHQAPASSLLKELEELSGVEITLVTVQPEQIPQNMHQGLSAPVQEAVPKACNLIVRRFFRHA